MTARIEEVAPKRQARASRLKPSTREAAWDFTFISPWVIGLLVFTTIPIVVSLLLSFTDYNLLKPDQIHFVGLYNYTWAAADPSTISSIFITLKFAAVSLPLTIATALGIALLVNHRLLVGRRVFRTLFFLPVQIPVTASVFIWTGFISGANRMTIAWLQSTSTSIGQALSSLPVLGALAACPLTAPEELDWLTGLPTRSSTTSIRWVCAARRPATTSARRRSSGWTS